MSHRNNHYRRHGVHGESISLWLKLLMMKVVDEDLESKKLYISLAVYTLVLPEW